MTATAPIPGSSFKFRFALAAAGAAIVIASLAASRIGDSLVDVGLDVAPAPSNPPRIEWSGGVGEALTAQPMEPIPSRYIFRSKPDSSVAASVPAASVVRYHGRIPRRALADFRIVFPADFSGHIERLYVATAIPRIFYAQGAPSNAWGRVVTNWNPPFRQGALILSIDASWEAGGTPAILLVGTLSTLLLAVFVAGCVWAWSLWRVFLREPLPPRVLSPFSWRLFLLFALPPVALWLVFFAGFYPAAMSPDSLNQWAQAETMVIDDFHPAVHTVTIKLLTHIWHSPAIVALAQIAAMSLVLAYAFSLLRRAGAPWPAVLIAYLCAAFSLRNAMMSVILWKDIPYSVLTLLFTAVLCRMLLDPSRLECWRWWAYLGALLALVPLYRHNGLLILLGMLVLIPFALPRFWKRILAGAGVCAALLAFVRLVLFPLLGVAPGLSFKALSIPSRIAPLVDQDVPFSAAEYEFLEKIRTFDDRWAYSQIDSIETLWPSTPPNRFDEKFAADNIEELGREYRSFLFRFPAPLLRHRIITLDYVFVPWQSHKHEIETITTKITDNSQGLVMRPLLHGAHVFLKMIVYFTLRPEWNWLFWRPALGLWAVLCGAGLLLWRTREWRYLLLYAPVLLNVLSIVIGGISQNMRYLYPLSFSASFLAGLAFIPKVPDQAPNKSA